MNVEPLHCTRCGRQQYDGETFEVTRGVYSGLVCIEILCPNHTDHKIRDNWNENNE